MRIIAAFLLLSAIAASAGEGHYASVEAREIDAARLKGEGATNFQFGDDNKGDIFLVWIDPDGAKLTASAVSTSDVAAKDADMAKAKDLYLQWVADTIKPEDLVWLQKKIGAIVLKIQ